MPFKPLAQASVQKPILPGGTIGGLKIVNPSGLQQEEQIKSNVNIGETRAKKNIDLQFKALEPLSGEAAKTFQFSIDALLGIEQLKDKVKSGANFILPEVFDRDTSALRTDLADVIGRLRSGGAIAGDEEKNFLSLIPGLLDKQGLRISKLNRLEAKFRNIGVQIGTRPRLEASLEEGRKIINQDTPSQNQSLGIFKVNDNGTERFFKAKSPEEAKKLESLGGVKVQ